MDAIKPAGAGRKKRIWLRRTLIILISLLALLGLSWLGLTLYFNERYFQTLLQSAFKDHFGRKAQITGLQVNLWSGRLSIDGFHLLNAEQDFSDPDTLRFKKLTAQVEVWPLLWSGGASLKGLRVILEQPELFIERRRAAFGGSETNVDDLVRTLTGLAARPGPFNTGLRGLSCALVVHDGTVHYREAFLGPAENALTDLELDLQCAALGEPFRVTGSFKLHTPLTPPDEGAVLAAELNWCDQNGRSTPGVLSAKLELPPLNLNGLGEMVAWSPNYAVDGQLTGVRLSYDGGLAALSGRFNASDLLSLVGRLHEVTVTGQAPGKNVAATFNGPLSLGLFQAQCPALELNLDYRPQGQPAYAQHSSCTLTARPVEAGATMWDAVTQPGFPLFGTVSLDFKEPVACENLEQAIDALFFGIGKWDLSVVKRLRVEAQAAAPRLTFGPLALEQPRLPEIVFDGGRLRIPSAGGALYGGQFTLNDARCDFTSRSLARSANFKLEHIDLERLLAPFVHDSASLGGYRMAGWVSAAGALSGEGFDVADPRTWNARVEGLVSDLVILKAGWAERAANLPARVDDTGIPALNVLAQLFLLVDLLDKVEFEPWPFQAQLVQGILHVPLTHVAGKGHWAGLELAFRGGLNLPEQVFAPDTAIWPSKLPELAQQILHLPALPPAERAAVMRELAEGRYAVAVSGPLSKPQPTDLLTLAAKFARRLMPGAPDKAREPREIEEK